LSADTHKVADSARAYIGVKEVGNNSGEMVKKFLASVHLGLGYSWCAGFVRYILDITKAIEPKIRSAMARAYITSKSINAKRVAKGYIKIPAGWLVIWQRGTNGAGHIGITASEWSGNQGKTIEGNTSSGQSGSQANGDGVYPKTRKITTWSDFRITHFTPVKI
jgi:hypothetical protein